MNKNLIIDRVDGIKSVTVGISFVHGSRNETSLTRGFSHFLEHMLFKGTKSRKSIDISRSIERLGGFINGFTTHDYILIYAKVPYYAINEAIDILIDIATNSTFGGLELEKNVVIEEISSIDDEPEEFIYEEYMKRVWKGTTLENPIAGTVESIEAIDKAKIEEFFEVVKSKGILLAISGNVTDLIIDERLEGLLDKEISSTHINEKRSSVITNTTIDFHSKLKHSVIGFPIDKIAEQEIYCLSAINGILLDGMSSRLFQLIREKHGLVYDIYPLIDIFGDMANYGVYFSSKPSNCDRVIELIQNEFDTIARDGLSSEELQFSKDYMKGNMLLGLENTNSRMFMYLKDRIYNKEIVGVDKKLQVIDSLSLEEINNFITTNLTNANSSIITLQNS